ncbi:MAG: RidA family protein [Gemmatimonadota bacterium]
MAEVKAVNPWTWQDQFGFSQAMDVRGAQRVLYCAGQTSTDADGNPLHLGDFSKQMLQAIDNLEAVLKQAGLKLSNVVRLNYYVTDIDAFMAAAGDFGPRLHAAQCKPASTLLKVKALFHPDILVEIEATAVQ